MLFLTFMMMMTVISAADPDISIQVLSFVSRRRDQIRYLKDEYLSLKLGKTALKLQVLKTGLYSFSTDVGEDCADDIEVTKVCKAARFCIEELGGLRRCTNGVWRDEELAENKSYILSWTNGELTDRMTILYNVYIAQLEMPLGLLSIGDENRCRELGGKIEKGTCNEMWILSRDICRRMKGSYSAGSCDRVPITPSRRHVLEYRYTENGGEYKLFRPSLIYVNPSVTFEIRALKSGTYQLFTDTRLKFWKEEMIDPRNSGYKLIDSTSARAILSDEEFDSWAKMVPWYWITLNLTAGYTYTVTYRDENGTLVNGSTIRDKSSSQKASVDLYVITSLTHPPRKRIEIPTETTTRAIKTETAVTALMTTTTRRRTTESPKHHATSYVIIGIVCNVLILAASIVLFKCFYFIFGKTK